MKTKEELNAQKEEVETVSKKLHELTEEELAQVSGGVNINAITVISTAITTMPGLATLILKPGN